MSHPPAGSILSCEPPHVGHELVTIAPIRILQVHDLHQALAASKMLIPSLMVTRGLQEGTRVHVECRHHILPA